MYYKQNTKHSLFEGRATTIECLNYILYVHTVNYELARCPKSRLSELPIIRTFGLVPWSSDNRGCTVSIYIYMCVCIYVAGEIEFQHN